MPSLSEVVYSIQNAVASVNNLTQLLINATTSSALRVNFVGGVRPYLLADRTYFVATTGSDSNDGLTAATAFLTIQKAIDTVAALDINTHNVTIQVAAGTYTGGALITGPWLGSGTVTLTGDTTTPSNVVISTTGDCIAVKNNSSVAIQGFKLTSSGRFLLNCTEGSRVNIAGNMEWGAYSFGGITVSNNGYITNNATACTISGGGGGVFLAAGTNGTFDNVVVSTWTVSANITVTIFALSGTGGYINSNSLTWAVGVFTVTGTKYSVSNRGMINTSGGGAGFFPGTVAGTGTNFGVAPWGLYL